MLYNPYTRRERRRAFVRSVAMASSVPATFFGAVYGAQQGIKKYFKSNKKRKRGDDKSFEQKQDKSQQRPKKKAKMVTRKRVRFSRKRKRSRSAFRRRPRRRTSMGGRRRGKRMYRRSNSNSSVRKMVYKALSYPRKFVSEANESHDIPRGKVVYICTSSFLTRNSLKAAWDDTGADGVVLGGLQLRNAHVHLAKAKYIQEIRNLSPSTMHLQVYWLMAKEDTESAVGTFAGVISALAQGWKDRMLDADEGTTVADIAVGNQTVSTKSVWLNPLHSSNLTRKWKVSARKPVVLKPGEVYYNKYSRRDFGSISYDEVSDFTISRTKRGWTAIPLIRVRMSLGVDTVDQSKVALQDGYFYSQVKFEYDFRFFSPHRSLIAMSQLKNDVFPNAGQGPEEDQMVEDL